MNISTIKRKKKIAGFTLIEIIVVVAILGILSAIAVPRLGGFSGSAEHRTNQANAKILTNAAHMIEATTGHFPTEEYWGATFIEIGPEKVNNLIYEKIVFKGNGSFKYDVTTGIVSIDGEGGGTGPVKHQYQLTVSATPGGTATGSGTYEEGAIVVISANPNTGYQFVEWTTNGGGMFDDKDAQSTNFTMPSQAVTVTASFELIPTDSIAKSITGSGSKSFTITFNKDITASTAPTGVTVSGMGSNQITYTHNGDFPRNAEISLEVTSASVKYNIKVRRNGNSQNWRIVP